MTQKKNTMTCEDMERRLLQDGLMDAAAREHLATCEACRQFATVLAMVEGGCETIPSAALDERILHHAHADLRWQRIKRRCRRLGALAACLVLALGLYCVTGRTSEESGYMKQTAPVAAVSLSAEPFTALDFGEMEQAWACMEMELASLEAVDAELGQVALGQVAPRQSAANMSDDVDVHVLGDAIMQLEQELEEL